MPVFKINQGRRLIDGRKLGVTSIVILPKYKVNGEETIIVKDVDFCELTLDHESSEYLIIKSMTNTLIKSDYLIDEEFEEIELQKGSSIELRFIQNYWYVMSSDGLKTS